MRFPLAQVHQHAKKAFSSVEVKSVGLYNSKLKLFLAGEGDFSFSYALSRHFGHAFNITATSIDKLDDLIQRYKYARRNVGGLLEYGADVSLGVNCVRMDSDKRFEGELYDRVIYNFPHAGFMLAEDNQLMIQKHQELCYGFFSSASTMLTPQGEVHITHKDGGPYEEWNLELLGRCHGLKLIERIPFVKETYPGYHQKKGDGKWADTAFGLGESSTYRFAKNAVESQ